MTGRLMVCALLLTGGWAAEAAAQDRPAAVVEAIGGWAGFVDERLDHHGVVGAGFRMPLTARATAGPEVLYMKGGPGHRDIVLAGNVIVDVSRRDAPVTWFLAGSLGVLHLSDQIGVSRVTFINEYFTGGFGVRVPVGEGMYLASDLRLGSELHWRSTVAWGIRLD